MDYEDVEDNWEYDLPEYGEDYREMILDRMIDPCFKEEEKKGEETWLN